MSAAIDNTGCASVDPLADTVVGDATMHGMGQQRIVVSTTIDDTTIVDCRAPWRCPSCVTWHAPWVEHCACESSLRGEST